MIPNPYGLTLQDWADQVTFELADSGPVAQLQPGTDWQEWAQRLLELNPTAQQAAPSPLGFADWRDWAARFVLAVT